MCIQEDYKMGICDGCKNTSFKDFKIPFPRDHHLNKLHDLTPEYKERLEIINKNAPNWGPLIWDGDDEQYFYFENTENLPKEEFLSRTAYDEEYRKQHKRTFTIPRFKGNMCTCC